MELLTHNFPEMVGSPTVIAQVSKEFTFHAAHKDDIATDKCGRLHGHTYKVRISVEGLKKGGMVLHGDILKEIYRTHLEPLLDHRYLNDQFPFNPTMENLCAWIQHEAISHLNTHGDFNVKVTLWETPTMFCEIG